MIPVDSRVTRLSEHDIVLHLYPEIPLQRDLSETLAQRCIYQVTVVFRVMRSAREDRARAARMAEEQGEMKVA